MSSRIDEWFTWFDRYEELDGFEAMSASYCAEEELANY